MNDFDYVKLSTDNNSGTAEMPPSTAAQTGKK